MSAQKERAAKALSALEGSFRYEDHQLMKDGAYAEVARRLQKRARYLFWLGVVCAGGLLVMAGVQVVEYGAEGDGVSLLLGVVYAVGAVATQACWARESSRLGRGAARALALVPGCGEEAEAPAAAPSTPPAA